MCSAFRNRVSGPEGGWKGLGLHGAVASFLPTWGGRLGGSLSGFLTTGGGYDVNQTVAGNVLSSDSLPLPPVLLMWKWFSVKAHVTGGLGDEEERGHFVAVVSE